MYGQKTSDGSDWETAPEARTITVLPVIGASTEMDRGTCPGTHGVKMPAGSSSTRLTARWQSTQPRAHLTAMHGERI